MSAGPAEAVTGDWDGSRTQRAEQAEARLAELQRQIRGAYIDVLEHQRRWAHGLTSEDRIRAVAYQTCASRLLRILDSQGLLPQPKPAPGRFASAPPQPPSDADVTRTLVQTPEGTRDPHRLGWLFRGPERSRP